MPIKCVVFAFLCILQVHSLFALTREYGIGDQGVAYPQTALEAGYNPAGLTDVGERFDIAGGMLYQNGYTTIKNVPAPFGSFNQRGSNSESKWLPLAIFGVARNLSKNLVVALSTDGTRSGKACNNEGFQAFGQGKFGAELEIPIILPSLAWRANSMHSLGVSFPVYIARANIRGVQNLESLSVAPGLVSNNGYEYAYAFGLKFGWLWHITPQLNFGACYTTRSLVGSHFYKYSGFFPKHGLLAVSPDLKVGVAYRCFHRANLAFQYECVFYQNNPTVANSSFSAAPFGSDAGPSTGWKNANVYTLGGDYWLTHELQVRMGWTYLPKSVVHSDNVNGNLGTAWYVFKNLVLCGATWYKNCCELGFVIGYALPRSVTSPDLASLSGGQIEIEHSQLPFMLSFTKKF